MNSTYIHEFLFKKVANVHIGVRVVTEIISMHNYPSKIGVVVKNICNVCLWPTCNKESKGIGNERE
jgi:hypothetical protein